MERLKTSIILLLLYFAGVFSSEELSSTTVTPSPTAERPSTTAQSGTFTDCSAQQSIKEMMGKLETVVTQQGACFSPEGKLLVPSLAIALSYFPEPF